MATTTTQAPTTPLQREQLYRSNFALFLLDGIFFTVAMSIMSSNTVIPDFIRRLTDSEVLIGFSSSMFEIGWMLPQLFVARYLVRAERKKWWFAGPNIIVRFAMPLFAVLVFVIGTDRPDLILIAFLVCYGLAAVGDGLVGVPWVDLTGSSLDNRWRARFFGLMPAISGVIMLIAAPHIGNLLNNEQLPFPNNYGVLFGIAGALFVLSIIPPLFLNELPSGAASTTVPTFREYIPALGRVLREDRAFSAMIITRMLSSLFMMAAPFYIGFATVELGLSSGVAVSNLLAMQTAGTLLGALIYSWMGNRHNLLYIRLALLTASALPISALLAGSIGPLPLYVGFFASGMALSSLFTSYLNWVIQHVQPEQRSMYTGLFNTVAALTLLLAPVLGGTIAQVLGYQAVFAAALVMILGAFFVVTRFIANETPDESAT